MTDAALARAVAAEAGAMLREMQRGGATGAASDAAANALILDRLRAARPGEFILSEESEDDLGRCAASRVWVVDPLDGTKEFAAGRDDWAVHVGLSIDGVAAEGAVALPARDLVLCSEHPRPAPPAGDPLRIAVSRSRPPCEAVAVAAALDAQLAPMGSAGAKAMAVVLGEADVYIHSGGQYVWDNCAPAAVARAAGLHVSRLDGSALVYNCADTWLPDLLICAPTLTARVRAALAACG